jgi:hypothetical protein
MGCGFSDLLECPGSPDEEIQLRSELTKCKNKIDMYERQFADLIERSNNPEDFVDEYMRSEYALPWMDKRAEREHLIQCHRLCIHSLGISQLTRV